MTSAPGAPTLDRDMLESLRQSLDDPSGDFIRTLAQVYEGQSATLMAEIVAAADQGDLPRLGEAAHSLKGSSATLGGARLAAMCELLEDWEALTRAVLPKVTDVQAELSTFQSELTLFLSEPAGATY